MTGNVLDAPSRPAPAASAALPRPNSEQLNAFFDAPPRREVNGRSRPTQRFKFRSDCVGVTVLEGGNELTAALIFEHLWRCGWLRRYKFQPFSLDQLDLPETTVPDALVELSDSRYFVVEIKSAKFFTQEKRDKFDATTALLKTRGLTQLLWTDNVPLNTVTWHNARHLQRAFRLDVTDAECVAVLAALPQASTLGQLMTTTDLPWEILIANAARGLFHLNLNQKFDEHAAITAHPDTVHFNHLFGARPNLGGWFERISDCRVL